VTSLRFTVQFHSWFRVGAAYGRDGVDAAIDWHDPLPADHLKGVMRDSARLLLGPEHPLIATVFGTPKTPSPWSWSKASPDGDSRWTATTRHRVAIDEVTHTARKDHLVLGEQAWIDRASFEVRRIPPIEGDDAPAPLRPIEDDQVRLLRASARGIHHLGAWRRRGLGWVGVSDDEPWDDSDIQWLLTTRAVIS